MTNHSPRSGDPQADKKAARGPCLASSDSEEPPPGGVGHSSTELASQPPIDSGDLLGGGSERLIAHNGEVYRLRLTRSGKLILHK